jgi:hypothetical protein
VHDSVRATTPAASSPIHSRATSASCFDDHTLVPGPDATVFPTRFEDWLLDNALAPAR